MLEVDDSLTSSREGVFAAGDAVLGPASVIEAIAHGKEASIAIDKYLGGQGILQVERAPSEGPITPMDMLERLNKDRQHPPTQYIATEERGNSFSEVGRFYSGSYTIVYLRDRREIRSINAVDAGLEVPALKL